MNRAMSLVEYDVIISFVAGCRNREEISKTHEQTLVDSGEGTKDINFIFFRGFKWIIGVHNAD